MNNLEFPILPKPWNVQEKKKMYNFTCCLTRGGLRK